MDLKARIFLAIAVIAGIAAGTPASAVDDQALFDHKPGIWEIAPEGTLSRWIVIHNLAEARGTGVFHIEVIGREHSRPVWDVRRIRAHMAVTKDALKRSVVKPLERGAVYPESYDDAYAQWKRNADGGRKVVCESSVPECLSAEPSRQGR
ncbi:MAG TPA: DUF5086 family protein [Deltaproteobacteria bacterium]|nr:DUF5086 family protein [Deltaproteobacteria bacterium]